MSITFIAIGGGDDKHAEKNVTFRSDQNGETVTLTIADDAAFTVNVDSSNTHVVNTAVNDGVHNFSLSGYSADTEKHIKLEGTVSAALTGWFRTWPTSMAGEMIVISSCISERETVVNPTLCSDPPVKLMNYITDTLRSPNGNRPLCSKIIGDFFYGEDLTPSWDPAASPATTPPVAHFEDRMRQTYELAAVKYHCRFNEIEVLLSDHDAAFASMPDQQVTVGNYTNTASSIDDITTFDAWPNANTARAYYMDFAKGPGAGAGYWNQHTVGKITYFNGDSRTDRTPTKGMCYGEAQLGALITAIKALESDETLFHINGDAFACDDGPNGDGWESDTTAPGGVGYIAQRNLIDLVAYKSAGKVRHAGGDRHYGAIGWTLAADPDGPPNVWFVGPYEDSLQRTPGATTARYNNGRYWSSASSSNQQDNRFSALRFVSESEYYLDIYAAGEGAGGGDEDVIVLEQSVQL